MQMGKQTGARGSPKTHQTQLSHAGLEFGCFPFDRILSNNKQWNILTNDFFYYYTIFFELVHKINAVFEPFSFLTVETLHYKNAWKIAKN